MKINRTIEKGNAVAHDLRRRNVGNSVGTVGAPQDPNESYVATKSQSLGESHSLWGKLTAGAAMVGSSYLCGSIIGGLVGVGLAAASQALGGSPTLGSTILDASFVLGAGACTGYGLLTAARLLCRPGQTDSGLSLNSEPSQSEQANSSGGVASPSILEKLGTVAAVGAMAGVVGVIVLPCVALFAAAPVLSAMELAGVSTVGLVTPAVVNGTFAASAAIGTAVGSAASAAVMMKE